MACSSGSAQALSVLVTLTLTVAAAAQDNRAGTEFQVNTYTTNLQTYAALAAKANGDFVVAWQSETQDGTGRGIFARRFSRAGVGLGAEFQVNTYTSSSQQQPSVASDAGGRFVVAWSSVYQDGGTNTGVFARAFSAAGTPVGVEFQVNTYTVGDQSDPEVALQANGDFVIVWTAQGGQDGQGNGVFARRFSSTGAPLTGELLVNSHTSSDQETPAIASEAIGDFVVVWVSGGSQDGSLNGIFGRRFTSAGTGLATEFQVNSFTTVSQQLPSVGSDADGDFVVSWISYNQDGAYYGLFAQRFSSTGARLAVEFQVSTHTVTYQGFSSVAAAPSGDFVIAWDSSSQDGAGYGVFARRFASTGTPLAFEFQVNTYTTDNQVGTSATAFGSGFVIGWSSFGQDGSSHGVFGQRFILPITLDIDGDGEADALTDALLALRYLFGFRGAVLVNGAVDLANCTRCDAASIEAYLLGISG